MSKIKSFVFLLLFAFCGQVLAMPLLACCDEMNETSMAMEMEADTEHCHTMEMDLDQPENTMDHEHMGCASCDFCLGAASILKQDSEVYALSPELLVSASHYQFIPLSSNSDSLFRPPIFA